MGFKAGFLPETNEQNVEFAILIIIGILFWVEIRYIKQITFQIFSTLVPSKGRTFPE